MSWSSILLRLKETITLAHLLTAANIMIVGVATWLTGALIAVVVEHQVLQVPYQAPRYVPPKETQKDKPLKYSEFSDILKYNIFNAEVEKKAPVEIIETVEPVKPGNVLNDILKDLELLGINYRQNFYIFCIIKHRKNKQEDIFTIGDNIFDTGASVHRIFTSFDRQRVLVKYGDEIGTLEFSDIDPNATAANLKIKPKQKPKPTIKSRTTANRSQPADISKYSTDGKNFYINAEEVDSHLNDFGTLLNQARMVPYFKKGQHQGFRVKAIDKGSLYEKLGLRNNDILKAVNGESLAEAGGEKLMGLFKLLRNEREFTVELQRGSQTQVLNYYVN